MNKPTVKLLGLFILFFPVIFPARLFADFELLDAIEEFGEKRYIKFQPARLHTGPLRIHPSLRNTVEYDSNIHLQKSDAREDVLFNIKPGVILELPIQRHQIAMGYEAEFEVFTKSPNQNDQNQSAFALIDLNFPDGYVNVLEKFSETSSRAGTTFTDRIPRYDQSIHPKLGYRWKRLIFEMAFRHYVRDFRRQGNDALDFQMVEWTEVVYYDLTARLKALVEYQVAQIDYDDNFQRNGTFQQARLGLDGEVLPNLTLKVRGGPHFRHYDHNNDYNNWVAAITAEYRFRENITFNAALRRQPVEATFGDATFYKEHVIEAGAEYAWRREWIFYSKARFGRHNYADRATVGAQTGFRRDNHAGVESGVRYAPIDWLEFELAYEYLHRNSNFSDFGYNDNRVSLTSTLRY